MYAYLMTIQYTFHGEEEKVCTIMKEEILSESECQSKRKFSEISFGTFYKLVEQGRLPGRFNTTLFLKKKYFYDPHDFYEERYYKEDYSSISVDFIYEKWTPSIKEILEHRDGEKAIQYLVERGLSVIGEK